MSLYETLMSYVNSMPETRRREVLDKARSEPKGRFSGRYPRWTRQHEETRHLLEKSREHSGILRILTTGGTE